MKPIFLLLILFLANPLFSVYGKIYKETDDKGNVIFTDRPTDQAEKVELPEINIMKSKKIPNSTSVPDGITPQENSHNLTEIADGYLLDKSSLQQQPGATERVRSSYRRGSVAGPFIYETIPLESWTFDIVKNNRRIPCRMKCPSEKDPVLESEGNIPEGVVNFLKSNICSIENDN